MHSYHIKCSFKTRMGNLIAPLSPMSKLKKYEEATQLSFYGLRKKKIGDHTSFGFHFKTMVTKLLPMGHIWPTKLFLKNIYTYFKLQLCWEHPSFRFLSCSFYWRTHQGFGRKIEKLELGSK